MSSRATSGDRAFRWICMFIGLGMAYATVFLPIRYFVRQVTWVKTEGLVLERFISEDAESGYTILEFTDSNGIKRQPTFDFQNEMMRGSDDNHFIVYYNPDDSTRSMPANHNVYFVLIFAPVAAFLCYVGWMRVPHSGNISTS